VNRISVCAILSAISLLWIALAGNGSDEDTPQKGGVIILDTPEEQLRRLQEIENLIAKREARLSEEKPSAVQKAIQKVLDDQVAAWNKGDLESFMAGYWKSDELTFFSGKEVTKGWRATLERYKKRYQADGKEMGKLTFSELQIDPLGPKGAAVRGRWKVVTSKETLEGLFTLIFEKTADGWKIVHDHTSAG
jgi:beta-aspartyl-peptidase (threonine type)